MDPEQQWHPFEKHRPRADHTLGIGSGYYLYTESSSFNTDPPGNPGKTALLQGPCIDLAGMSSATWHFWYHMRGNAMGNLYAEVAPGCSSTWTTQFSVSGDQGSDWIQGQVDLSAFAGTQIGLRFRGLTGSSYTSDMAIDDISLDALVSVAPNVAKWRYFVSSVRTAHPTMAMP